VVGAVLGSLARVFFAAVEAAGQAISSLAGLTGIFNQEITSDEQGSPLSSLLSLSATVLLLASDMHLLIFKGMLNSYWSLPPGMSLGEMIDLKKMVQTLSGSFYVVLQISGPFVFFALLFNLAIGLLNKLVPQIPVYFVSSPFVAAGGLVMLQFLVKPMLSLFVAAFAGWLAWR
jgi:flagellar biosynthetic protein FliR